MKILGFFPGVLAKHEISSIFVQSLTMFDTLTFTDLQYALFLVFVVEQEKQGKYQLISDPKLSQKVTIEH